MISPSKPTTQRLRLDQIRLDGDTQPREELDPNHIEDLKADAQAGDTFPPLDVFFDGREYWLADGFHRWHTYHRLEIRTAEVKTHEGNIQAAQWYALTTANRTHGKRRTREDKARAVRLALLHPNAAGRSDRDLAADLGVDKNTVAKHRAMLEAGGEITTSRSRTGRDGKSYPAPNPKTAPGPPDRPPMPPNPFEDDPKSEPEPEAAAPATPQPEPKKITDGEGRPVPPRFHEVFKRAAEYDALARQMSLLKRAALALANDPIIGHHLHPQEIAVYLDNARSALKFAKPHAICPYCRGKRCPACRQTGYVGRDVFKQAPDREEETLIA